MHESHARVAAVGRKAVEDVPVLHHGLGGSIVGFLHVEVRLHDACNVERAGLPWNRAGELGFQRPGLLPRDIVVAGAEGLSLLLWSLLPVGVPDAAVQEDRNPLPDPFVFAAGLPAAGRSVMRHGVPPPRRTTG